VKDFLIVICLALSVILLANSVRAVSYYFDYLETMNEIQQLKRHPGEVMKYND